MDIELLIKSVIQCAYNVHQQLAPGFLESVYRNALIIELNKKEISVRTEVPIDVYYDECIVGEFRADLMIEDKIIIELKAIQKLLPIHEMQLVNYLNATKTEDGLLINFGSEHIEIKRKYRTYRRIHRSEM